MTGIFISVLQMSFYGTVAGFGALLLGWLTDHVRAPRWIVLILWGMVALRLTVPVSIHSTMSLYQFWDISEQMEMFRYSIEDSDNKIPALEGNTAPNRITTTGNLEGLTGSGNVESAMATGNSKDTFTTENLETITAKGNLENIKNAMATKGQETEQKRQKILGTVLESVSWVWFAGVLVLWICGIVSYNKLKHRLQFSVMVSEGVYETDEVSSPCVSGLFRPRIYLLPNLTRQQREHILLHEQMHIKYLDFLWKVMSFGVVSLHWFNPFLWKMYYTFQEELEKACDERVLARLGLESRADYGESLLALSRKKNWKSPTPVAFGESSTKKRLKRILNYRKPLMVVSFPVAVLAVVLCSVFLTVPKSVVEAKDIMMKKLLVQDFLSDLEKVPSEGFESEIFQELISGNNVIYQAKKEGILRVTSDGRELIYQRFPGMEPEMTIFEGKLYFKGNPFYEEGIADWEEAAICWIDLDTLETGWFSQLMYGVPIKEFHIDDGVLIVRFLWNESVQAMMLRNDVGTNVKGIAELSQIEAYQLGVETTQAILKNKCTLMNISHQMEDGNMAYLDMDGDGMPEKIILEPSKEFAEWHRYSALDYYSLQIGGASFEGSGDNVFNNLWALSLDGKTVLLVLYEDGASGDPYTHFFRYINGQIIEIGGFAEDIQYCRLSQEGIIMGTMRKDIVQTDWIDMSWQLNESGQLEEILQETYDFQVRNEVRLCEDLPLYKEVGNQQTAFMVNPQMVKFLKTTADWGWVLIETADGQQGWAQIENYKVVDLDKDVMEVFEALNMAG